METDMTTKTNTVPKRDLRRGLFVLAALMASTQAASALEVSARQRAICTPDAIRFCSSAMSDQLSLANCMLRAKPQLTSACRAVVSTLQRQYAQNN
jgi:hypothetical protein